MQIYDLNKRAYANEIKTQS
jgi:hypothetical protein